MMNRRFVIEAVLVAIYGQLLIHGRQVEYIVPYTSIMELYEMRDSNEPIMPDADEDFHVKQKIIDLIAFFEDALNRKKIEKALTAPWKKSAPLLVNEHISFTVVYAVENAQFGEIFDPIETELILTASREQAPLLTDQVELIEQLIEHEVQIQAYDIDDFEFAMEDGVSV